MGRLQQRMPVSAQIAVALIVGQNEDDVGLLVCLRDRGQGQEGSE